METNQPNTTDRIVEDLTRYVNLKVDATKLDLVENLSIAFSNAFGIVIFIVLGGMGLMFFTGVLTYLLGLLIGSMLWASVIMGSLFMIAAIVIMSIRQKMFTNPMVRMFSRMFFKPKADDNE